MARPDLNDRRSSHSISQPQSRLFKAPTQTHRMRIGIFGGSFDPAHEGHFHLAATALKRLQLDYVWWIPARGNPLKTTQTPFEDRIATARLYADHPRMVVTDIEQRLGLRYTIDLVRVLTRRFPTTRFVWLMGGDNLASFHTWQAWYEIARTLPIAIVARPGAGPRARLSKFAVKFARSRIPNYSASALAERNAPAWVHLRAPLNGESSTRLRMLEKGKPG